MYTASDDYLITESHVLRLIESKKYPGFVTVAKDNATDTDFHIYKLALKLRDAKKTYKNAPPPSCKNAYTIPEDSRGFDTFYTAWSNNDAYWYRGFNCSHLRYPEIQNGVLQSEGMEDTPTFTMSGKGEQSQNTRWLPGAYDRAICEGVSISGTDQYVSLISEANPTSIVPIAITVSVKLGKTIPIPFAYLNAGEQVVQGPLKHPQFTVCTLMCEQKKKLKKIQWEPTQNIKDLPPPRPYQPEESDITEWWSKKCQSWSQALPVTSMEIQDL